MLLLVDQMYENILTARCGGPLCSLVLPEAACLTNKQGGVCSGAVVGLAPRLAG